MAKKRDQSELPPLRMVRKGMSLVPADAFSEEMLDGIRFNVPIDVHWTYELLDPKRKKFWAVLNNVIKNCRTPWTNSKAAADALKTHLGVISHSATLRGDPVKYPGSLLDLTDPEFDAFYEGAMATLHRVTGIDPESLRRAAPKVQGEAGPATNVMGDPIGREAPAESESEAEPDEREMVNDEPSNVKVSDLRAAFDPGAIVDQLIAKATATPADVPERQALVRAAGEQLMAEFPDQHGFLGTVVHHCNRVAKGDLRAGSAAAYLKSIAPPAR